LHTIAQYVHKFNPTFLGARGSDTQIENLTNALGIVYQRMNTQDKHKQYDHTGVILLVNPAGKLTALFSFPHNAVNIAHDFLEITLHDKTE
jgi:protein SCO1/2